MLAGPVWLCEHYTIKIPMHCLFPGRCRMSTMEHASMQHWSCVHPSIAIIHLVHGLQARRCGAKALAHVFSLRSAEVLLKRHAWPQLLQELDALTALPDSGMDCLDQCCDPLHWFSSTAFLYAAERGSCISQHHACLGLCGHSKIASVSLFSCLDSTSNCTLQHSGCLHALFCSIMQT